MTESRWSRKRGAIKVSFHSQLFLFNAVAFLSIPSKSLKFRLVVFSIPTAPTKLLDCKRLTTAFDTNKTFDTN
jgi:hypothetical protein